MRPRVPGVLACARVTPDPRVIEKEHQFDVTDGQPFGRAMSKLKDNRSIAINPKLINPFELYWRLLMVPRVG